VNRLNLLFPLVVFLLPLIVFFPSSSFALLHWDDLFVIQQSAGRFSWEGILEFFFAREAQQHYKPIAQLSFAWNYALAGMSPAVYHWTNILLHATNSLLLFFVLKKGTTYFLWDKRESLFFAAAVCLVWSLHPLRVEAVAWVSARPHLLAFFFSALSALAFLQSLSGKTFFFALSILAYSAALLSYPIAIGLPLLFFLLQKSKKLLWFLLPVALFLIQQVSYRFTATQAMQATQSSAVKQILESFYLWQDAILKHLAPINLAPVYLIMDSENAFSLSLLATFLLLLATAAFFYFRKKELLFSWLAFLLLLAPSFADRPPIVMAHDRYSYVAGAALITLLFLWIRRMHSNRTLFPIACAAFLALPSTLLTKKQMSIWVDSESLYSYLLDRVGDHPYRDRLLADLVGFYRAEKRYPEAIRELNELIARNPRDAQAYAYRAMLWNTLEDKNKARADLQRALELDPNLPGARELGEQI
jgi:hypothetical protein